MGPWGGTDPPAVAYSYAPGRGAVHALKLLDHYRGIVQCDGYAAYKSIADAAGDEAITLAFCWAHLRRRFFDIAKDGSAPIASEALERIAALYAIEKTIRGHSSCARRATRQEKSKPLVLALKKWFEQQLARVSAKSIIAEAIRYGPRALSTPAAVRNPVGSGSADGFTIFIMLAGNGVGVSPVGGRSRVSVLTADIAGAESEFGELCRSQKS